ncbi:hypothetical protein, partial [Neisseria meningitidis serogroup B]
VGIYRKKQKPLRRHSRAGGNLVRSVSVFLASAATLNF